MQTAATITIRAREENLYRMQRTFATMLGKAMLENWQFRYSSSPGPMSCGIRYLHITMGRTISRAKAIQLVLMVLRLAGSPRPRQVYYKCNDDARAEFIRELSC